MKFNITIKKNLKLLKKLIKNSKIVVENVLRLFLWVYIKHKFKIKYFNKNINIFNSK